MLIVIFLILIAVLFLGLMKPSLVKMDSRKKVLKIFGGIITLFFILLVVTTPKDSKKEGTHPNSFISPNVASKDKTNNATSTINPTDQLKAQITDKVNQILGEKTNSDKKRIRDVVVSSLDIPEISGTVIIRFNADENLTHDMTKKGIWLEDIKIFKEVSKLNPEISFIRIVSYLPFNDAYGNTEDAIAVEVELEKETWEKINWDNFLIDNLPIIADYYGEAPFFSK